MTYYAVTDDPNELAHFGIKGMKWGIRRTDAQLGHPRHTGSRKPRSTAYKKAQSKLGKMMKSGIKKAKANWKAYNSPEAKYMRQTDRALEKARKGKLKYGKLDDWQVQRITQRLDMERQARALANTEQRFRTRLVKSISDGVVAGVGQGFGRRASEAISRKSTLKTDRMRIEQQHQLERKQMKQRHKLERDFQEAQMRWEKEDAKQKTKNKVNAEYYEEAARRGYNHPVWNDVKSGKRPKLQTNTLRAKRLNAWKDINAAEERTRKNTEAYDRAYLVERAKSDVKGLNPSSSPKKEKKKKDKGPGASQAPIINIYTNDHSPRRNQGSTKTVTTRNPNNRRSRGGRKRN